MLRLNFPLQHLRQWYHRHQHQNLTSNSHQTPINLRLDASSQNRFAGLQLANQNPENSSPRFRNRSGYPNLFDRLTPKR
jgi:hypothetical protein